MSCDHIFRKCREAFRRGDPQMRCVEIEISNERFTAADLKELRDFLDRVIVCMENADG